MRIEVTEADIIAGKPGDPYNCAIARAIKRQMPHILNPKADKDVIRWRDPRNDTWVRHATPLTARAWEKTFDLTRARDVQPFDFTLTPADAVVEPVRHCTAEASRRAAERREAVKAGQITPRTRRRVGRRWTLAVA